MVGSEEVVGALGILVLAGVLGRLFLKKTGFSDVFLLLLFGAAAGALLPADAVSGVSQFIVPIGSLTLFMIILDEGLHLSLDGLKRHAHKAILLSVLSFAASFLFVFLLSYFALGVGAGISLLLGALFAAVAPELLTGFLSSLGVSDSIKEIGDLEAVLSEAVSVMLCLFLAGALISAQAISAQSLPYDILLSLLLSIALGGVCAALWKGVFSRVAEESEHLLVIGLGAILYFAAGWLGANGVISVFVFAFFLGNTRHPAINEVKKFQFELSFFLRTFFLVYLGMLLFHSPKPAEVALIALAIALLLAVSRLIAGRVMRLFEKGAREDRLLEVVSSRGLTVAVLSIVVSSELTGAGMNTSFDLPLLALFVIFFSNLISTLMVLGRRHGKAKLAA